ncbi:hypothetical protein BGZ94_007537 [Podila epigama]|nr:hypothetical protein BGZ94_007537 [Podila epigama]
MVIATGVGVMSESKGTWQYEVVQQTRAEERNRDADEVAANIAATRVQDKPTESKENAATSPALSSSSSSSPSSPPSVSSPPTSTPAVA